jgi:hypothetical protein
MMASRKKLSLALIKHRMVPFGWALTTAWRASMASASPPLTASTRRNSAPRRLTPCIATARGGCGSSHAGVTRPDMPAGRFFHCRPGPAQSRFIDNPFDNVPDRIREKGNHKPDAGHAPVLHFPVASVMRLGRITVRRTISMGESRCCDIGWGRRDPGV